MKRLLLIYVCFALYMSCYSQTTISNDYLGELCRISVNLSTDEITDGYFVYQIPIPNEGFSSTLAVQGPGQPKLFQNANRYYLCIRSIIENDIELGDDETKTTAVDVFVNKWYSGQYSSSGCGSTCSCTLAGNCNPQKFCSCSGAHPCYYRVILDIHK